MPGLSQSQILSSENDDYFCSGIHRKCQAQKIAGYSTFDLRLDFNKRIGVNPRGWGVTIPRFWSGGREVVIGDVIKEVAACPQNIIM